MHEFDPNIYYAVAQLLVLLGRIPVHYKHGAPVVFFRPAGAVKYWVKASTPVFGFFLYYTLDKVVCPYLANLSHAPLDEERLSVQQEAPQLLLYLADDIVWHMGFNSADRQEKVAI